MRNVLHTQTAQSKKLLDILVKQPTFQIPTASLVGSYITSRGWQLAPMSFNHRPALPDGHSAFSTLQSIFWSRAPYGELNLGRRVCAPIAEAIEASIPVAQVQGAIHEYVQKHIVDPMVTFLHSVATELNMDQAAVNLLLTPFRIEAAESPLRFTAGIHAEYKKALLLSYKNTWQAFFRFGPGAVSAITQGIWSWYQGSTASLITLATQSVLTYAAGVIASQQRKLVAQLSKTVCTLSSQPLADAQLQKKLLALLPSLILSDILDGTFFTRAQQGMDNYHAQGQQAGAGGPPAVSLAPGEALVPATQPAPVPAVTPSQAAWDYLLALIAANPAYLHTPNNTDMKHLERKRVSHHPVRGLIYVMSNVAFVPGMVKIGLTKNAAVLRAKQLRTTGVPKPFKVEQEHQTDHTAYFECFMHIVFGKVRVAREREFFNAPLPLVAEVAAAIMPVAYHELRRL